MNRLSHYSSLQFPTADASVCKVPACLAPGDLLWAIAPSGGLREIESFEAGLSVWRDRGYRVQLMQGYDDRWGYLAGSDSGRRQQLMAALSDDECRGILCVRGGYGGTRLLEGWQWPANVDKWLIGFSDITSLLWSLSRVGVSSLHGPVLTTLADEPEWSVTRLFNWVEHYQIEPLVGQGWGPMAIGCGGVASGRLLPGNLCVATHLLGTAAEPDLTGAILAFEDVGEAPYRLDRMLTQWRSTGKLSQIKGVALGRFSGWPAAGAVVETGSTLSVLEVMRDRLGDLKIPIVSDLPFGHDGDNAVLPVGLPVELDADKGLLSWL
ncbi:MAG: LD-carboxypeptidase [Phormidesmis sp.]